MTETELLVRDKYDGHASKVTAEDRARLAAGEPLAYVIGWVPFLDARIELASKPLIPRPETEWWTDELITHLRGRYGSRAFRVLDLCAGSGAIGIAILKAMPNAHVSFGELVPEHCEQIRKNLLVNDIDPARADVRASNLFRAFKDADDSPIRFDLIATNPPYVPAERELDTSVTEHEPHAALYSGAYGLLHISAIASRAEQHLFAGGELWMECDIANIEQAMQLVERSGSDPATILSDLHGRPRVVVAYFA